MTDVRRFDFLEKIVKDERRRLDDLTSTLLARLGAHTHGVGLEARYNQTVAQSIPNVTDTKLAFNSAITTSSDVTASGVNNTDFLLNRGGLWRASVGVRYVAGTTGERHIFIQTGSAFAVANRIASQTVVNVGTAPVTVNCSTDFRVAAGTVVIVGAWQNTGAAVNTDVGFGGTNHIALTWLRP